jgi:hypothetical protein
VTSNLWPNKENLVAAVHISPLFLQRQFFKTRCSMRHKCGSVSKFKTGYTAHLFVETYGNYGSEAPFSPDRGSLGCAGSSGYHQPFSLYIDCLSSCLISSSSLSKHIFSAHLTLSEQIYIISNFNTKPRWLYKEHYPGYATVINSASPT